MTFRQPTKNDSRDDRFESRKGFRLSWSAIPICFLVLLLVPGCGGGQFECPNPDVELSAGITPAEVTLAPGQSARFTVTTNDIGQNSALDFVADPLDVTPDGINARTPIVASVDLTVPLGTAPGEYALDVKQRSRNMTLASALITVREQIPTGPHFAFTANRQTVSAVTSGFSQPVTFTLTSVQGFEGEVSINWEEEFGVVPSDPEPRPFTVTVEPGVPVTFVRTFYRHAGHEDPLRVTFIATSGQLRRTITITVNHRAE